MSMRTLQVELGEDSYPIYIGRDLFSDSALLSGHVAGRQVAVVSNETVAPLYVERVRAALGERSLITEIVLPDGEQFKTLATLQTVFDRLLAEGHQRDTTLVAVGGGVVGDLTGFAAASYMRGVRLVQVPTTLLSQVDSSVGGKTGVNHALGKNMIGAFYQPCCVLIDTDTLQTLPDRELSAGLAEVVKYGLIRDREFYRWLQGNADRLLTRDQAALTTAIETSCAGKAAVVAEDEREHGLRAILNLGHTFGHAIETAQGYGNWLHGEAVAAGLCLAMRLSVLRGWVAQEEVADLQRLLERMGLPTRPPQEMDAEQFLALMQRDKKVSDGRLRLVLLRDIGAAAVVADVSREELLQIL